MGEERSEPLSGVKDELDLKDGQDFLFVRDQGQSSSPNWAIDVSELSESQKLPNPTDTEERTLEKRLSIFLLRVQPACQKPPSCQTEDTCPALRSQLSPEIHARRYPISLSTSLSYNQPVDWGRVGISLWCRHVYQTKVFSEQFFR